MARRLLLLLMLWMVAPAAAQEVSPPGSFEAIAVSTQEIRLYWRPVEGATGYRVTVNDGPAKELPADAKETAFSDLAPNQTYRFSLLAARGDAASKPLTYIERTF